MRLKKIIVLFIVIIVLLIPISCYAMTTEEFFSTYDYEYKYMVKYNNGDTNYISAENPVTFSMSKYRGDGKKLKSGNSLWINSSGTLYRLKGNGTVSIQTEGSEAILKDVNNLIGFDYVDVYRRSGESFFFPNDLKQSPFRQILAGLIPILGLLVLSIALQKAWAFLRSQLMH